MFQLLLRFHLKRSEHLQNKLNLLRIGLVLGNDPSSFSGHVYSGRKRQLGVITLPYSSDFNIMDET